MKNRKLTMETLQNRELFAADLFGAVDMVDVGSGAGALTVPDVDVETQTLDGDMVLGAGYAALSGDLVTGAGYAALSGDLVTGAGYASDFGDLWGNFGAGIGDPSGVFNTDDLFADPANGSIGDPNGLHSTLDDNFV